MAVKTKKKTEPEHHQATDYLESSEALAEQFSKTEEFLAENKTLVFGVIGVIVLAVAGFFGYQYYVMNQNQQAQSDMFQAVYYFESDSLELALTGDGNNLGFIDIIEDYGVSDAANLASYYAGAIYLKQGKFEEAIEYLKNFSADDLLVQARSYSLIGDAYMELGTFESAADYYDKAANYKPNKQFTPTYLMKAALAYEKLSDIETAKKRYEEIIEKYWDSSEVQKAKKYKSSLKASAS